MALLFSIGVVAALAILAALLLPTLIRELDFRVARDERATLKTFGTALQSAIRRHAYIPSQTNWANTVAGEAGMASAAVATNPRGQPRLLLIDTNGWFNPVSLPYTQTSAGSAILPLNPRLIIASSLGKALPLSAGPLSAGEFTNLWNAAEGSTNFPTNGLWVGWNGRSDDVKLERVNLQPLFVSLRVETYRNEALNGLYAIGTNNTLYPAIYDSDVTNNPPRFYLQNTVLKLYSDAGNLDSTQILIRDSAFKYENRVWKGSVGGGATPGGVDIGGVVYDFLNAVPNTEAQNGAAQQQLVIQSMMGYMSNYIAWANGNFTDNGLKTYLLNTVQPNMISTVQGLFQGNANAYYPTNASGP